MKLSIRQKKAVKKLSRRTGGAVWWRVGTGKTRIIYAIFAMIAKRIERPCYNFLVVCRREAFQDWEEEIERLELNWRCLIVESESDMHGFMKKTGRTTIRLMSHGKLKSMKHFLLDYASMFDGVAYHEGFLYKNPQSDHCKVANKISEMVGRAFIASGSVMTARNISDIYGQLYAVNQHHVLGRTFTEFRSRYLFELKINPFSPAVRLVAAKGSMEKIVMLIRDRISVYHPTNKKREVYESVRNIHPTKQQLRLFRELKGGYYTEYKGREFEIKVAATLALKCQQISDGFLKLPDKKRAIDGKIIRKGEILHVPSAKMDRLVSDVAKFISEGEQVVIWCAFQYSCDLILQRLQKAFPRSASQFYVMHGSNKFDTAGWRENGLVAICTVGSGSSINHFRNVQTAIYYSHDYRWLHMQQSKGRNDREDSLHKEVYYTFLQTEGSLDSVVYKAVHASGRKEAELIALAGVKRWLQQ